ncbi:hypothetical protein N7535_006183 [Penicillium sp. DV-2018c]|nr:hypothetical protein N7535_006183 [Penicillium sp. DV-2018c]
MDPAISRYKDEEERVQLRSRYNEAVSDLLQALKSEPKATYSSDNLAELGVDLASFNPEDSSFLESKACLFKPISSKELEGFSVSDLDLPEGSRYWYSNFDEIYHHPTNVENASTAYIIKTRADQIFRCLRVYYTKLEKKSGRDTVFFDQFDAWNSIQADSSFLDNGMGLLYGRCDGVPRWDVQTEREWQDDPNDSETTSPHIMLVAIRNRLDQKEFEKTSLFPVLAISFFGPRHGRLLQANFTKSGILKVRASPVYSFMDQSTNSIATRTQKDAPTQAPEYVSPSTEFEKENITPKEDDYTPSVEEISPCIDKRSFTRPN